MQSILDRSLAFLRKVIKRAILLFFECVPTNDDFDAHSRNLQDYRPHATHRKRQELLHENIQRELQRIFGVEGDLKNFDTGNRAVYSIIDHHDILNHSLFIFPNIVSNFFRFRKKSLKKKAIITITDAGIPVSHSGSNRGMILDRKRFRLFPHSKRRLTILRAPKQTAFTLAKQATALNLKTEYINFLKKVDTALFSCAQEEILRSYYDQVTLTNRMLWKQLFAKEIREQVPELFHLSGEMLATAMLKTYLMDREHPIYKVIFDKKIRNKVLELFNSVPGCWSDDRRHGTHFFWGINKQGGSERLWLDGNRLVSLDGSIDIFLTPQSILLELDRNRIYPSLFVVYGIIIFYCGIKPLTGSRSDDYISKMRERWLKLNLNNEKDLISSIPMHNTIQDSPCELYALDIMYKGGLSMKYLEKIESARIFVSKIRNFWLR